MPGKFAMVPLAWAQQPPPAAALQVWIVLWQQRMVGSWPTQAEIADATGKSRAAVKTGIRWLIDNRLIARVEGTGNRTSSYVLGWDPSKTKGVRNLTHRGSENEPPSMEHTEQGDLLGGQKASPQGVRKLAPHLIKNKELRSSPLGKSKSAPASAPPREVLDLINRWAEAWGKDRDPRFKPHTTKRAGVVKRAIKQFGVETLQESLRGWAIICEDPWRKMKPNRHDISLFFRDQEHVQEGLAALNKPHNGLDDFDTIVQSCATEDTDGDEKTDGITTQEIGDPWMAVT